VTARGDSSDNNNDLKRRTTVRFSFDTTPDKKGFIQAVSGDLPRDSIKSLPNGKIDITLRNEGLDRALIADRIRLKRHEVETTTVCKAVTAKSHSIVVAC
jgi:hypothetical protein